MAASKFNQKKAGSGWQEEDTTNGEMMIKKRDNILLIQSIYNFPLFEFGFYCRGQKDVVRTFEVMS